MSGATTPAYARGERAATGEICDGLRPASTGRAPRTPVALLVLALGFGPACDDGRVGAGPDDPRACAGRLNFYCDCPGIEGLVAICPGQPVESVCPCEDTVPAPDAAPGTPDPARPRPPMPGTLAPTADAAPPPDLPSPDAAPPDLELPPDAAVGPLDAAPPDAALPVGPYRCPAPPLFASVVDGGHAFDIFRHEASHPLASARSAFPGALSTGDGPRAPAGEVEACARPGVRPWHTVTWDEADAACRAGGWRLCTTAELLRACAGPERRRWTFGNEYEEGACNVREGYRAAGAAGASEAPTGQFPRCVSAEGLHDLTGNLWEWVAADGEPGRRYQGAGWRTVAERHRTTDLVCAVEARLGLEEALAYANPDVGFRCCR